MDIPLSKRLKLKADYLFYSVRRTHLEARKTVIAADEQRRLLDGHPDTIIFHETAATPTPSQVYNKYAQAEVTDRRRGRI